MPDLKDQTAPMQQKNYSGYKSFSYLEAGTDYKVWPLAPELNRVPSRRPEVTPEQEARVRRLFQSGTLRGTVVRAWRSARVGGQ